MLIKILQDSRALTKRSESLSKKGYQVKNNFLNIKICQQLQLTQYVYTYLYIYIVHTYIYKGTDILLLINMGGMLPIQENVH